MKCKARIFRGAGDRRDPGCGGACSCSARGASRQGGWTNMQVGYTYYSRRFGATRADEKGWRLDYCLVGPGVLPADNGFFLASNLVCICKPSVCFMRRNVRALRRAARALCRASSWLRRGAPAAGNVGSDLVG